LKKLGNEGTKRGEDFVAAGMKRDVGGRLPFVDGERYWGWTVLEPLGSLRTITLPIVANSTSPMMERAPVMSWLLTRTRPTMCVPYRV
jgi:hypothetical protein